MIKNDFLTVWDTDELEKVLRKKQYEKTAVDGLHIKLYKNETEGVRFFCTPNRAVKKLTVEVAPLEKKDGSKGADICVSTQYVLYVPIEKSSAGTKSEIGEYPDVLLPFDLAEKYGKTCIEADCNQELRISVQTKADTVAGTYTSKVKLTADGEEYEIPLTVTVWDYALTERNHTKQLFIIDSAHLELVEGGGYARYKRYYDDLLKYRINGSRLPFSLQNDYVTVTADFIEQLRKYYADERVSVICLPAFYNEEYSDVDYEKTEYLFDELIKACEQDGVNYLEKSMNYLWILDEPHLSPTRTQYCKTVLPKFEKLKRKLAKKCRELESGKGLYTQLARSFEKLPNVITSGVNRQILPNTHKEYEITWCPAFPAQDEMIKMWQTLNKGEKWWYGCNWPVPPYPTYHIDDTLLSSRLLSWMQYDYEVTGNLYWRINYWARKKEGVLQYVDPYKGSTYETTNGEGMLVYPGKPFGLDTFVPSLRLESVRDGIEDFEALYALDKEMEQNAEKRGEKGLSVNQLLSPIYTRLFNKAILPGKIEIPFESAREAVAGILVAAKKYEFFVVERNPKEKRIRFYTTAEQVECKGGRLEKAGALYIVQVDGDCAILNLQKGEEACEVTLYVADFPRTKKYAMSDNWAVTEKKYGIQADAADLVAPYYKILEDGRRKNYFPCCKDLGALITFVWRTETAIVKKKDGKRTQVSFYVPRGEFKFNGEVQIQELDETGRCYTLTTEEKSVDVEITNEKGKFQIQLYL